MDQKQGFLSNFFDFTGNKTDLKTEVIAGLTTFVTMAYIIIVNPVMLAGTESGTGMDYGAVLTATCPCSRRVYTADGIVRELSLCPCSGYGIERFFYIYALRDHGTDLADRSGASSLFQDALRLL